ncbi:MAG: T9SS type A sorting domain-containing protein [Ignavibacteriaceae bacterium]|nr:T9SS type A sorting domain-containing protein [Ignavibacteriaceae bacterium]
MLKSLRLLSVSLFLILFSSSLFAQWVAQTSNTTNRVLNMKAVSANTVWAAIRGGGEILKTTDGGTTWTKYTITTPVGLYMYGVEAFDANTAWVTGTVQGSADAYIFKTTDGGTTWTQQFNSPTGFGDGVRFFDANNGIYWGDPEPYPSKYWELYTTTNGGTNWTRVPKANIPDADSVNGEYGAAAGICVVGNNVWFTAYSAVAGTPNRIFKSTNRGLNWTVSQYTPVGGTSSSNYVAFKNATHGVGVSTDGTTARTTDGGTTWTTASVSGAVMRYVVNITGTGRYIAIGNAGASWITYDDGANWSVLTTPLNTNTLYAITQYDGMVWAGGNTGTILKWGGSPLPVEFTAFTSSVTGNSVTLKWTTASETNNRGFEVERKGEDGQFVLRGFIEGAGTSVNTQNYAFTDADVTAGKYTYRIKQMDFDGRYAYSDEIEVDVTTPAEFELAQNYPNPFNPSTAIKYSIKFDGPVSLRVYDNLGTQVAELVNEHQKSGTYTVNFDASGLSSGVYFYSITSPGFNATKKLTILK